VRKLNLKDGVVNLEETQTNGSVIQCRYPTTMPTGMKWRDEWTLSEDGKTYSALRQMVSAGNGGGFGGGQGPVGGKGKGGGGGPETYTKIQ
jgi:hypothetical protein